MPAAVSANQRGHTIGAAFQRAMSTETRPSTAASPRAGQPGSCFRPDPEASGLRACRRLIGFGRQREATILSVFWMSLTSSKSGNVLPKRSQPGLNVMMFLSNIPWNSPMVDVSFWRISQVLGLVAAKHPEAELLVERT